MLARENVSSVARRVVAAQPVIVTVVTVSAVIALLSLASGQENGALRLSRSPSQLRVNSGGAATPLLDMPKMCDETGRCSPLDNSKKFAFTHISKSAGTSVQSALERLIPRGHYFSEHEPSVHWHMKKFPSDYNLISLKSPRHHVWSLFTECKYGGWAKSVSSKSFSRSGDMPESDDADFQFWLDRFVPLGETGYYNCYHPANYQARALTARGSDPHGLEGGILEPNFDDAASTYWGQAWVLLTEFYHESMCLLHYRLSLGPNGLRGAPDEDAGDFLETK